MSQHKEINFETEIFHHLAMGGWLSADTQRVIYLLQERRAALISAAVTSQIDVREI